MRRRELPVLGSSRFVLQREMRSCERKGGFSEEEFKEWCDKYQLLRMMTDTAAYSLEPLRTDYVIVNDASEDVVENCIYPLLFCGSIMSSTHFTERKNCPMYQFVYTFYGKGRLRYEHHIYSLEPGTIFLIDCNRPHYFHADSPEGWGYLTGT